ncbi:MAG: TA system VapC family ribonuclease toxin [Planctomycetota bacterium]
MSVLLDVNVLVAAHRVDHPAHTRCLALVDGPLRNGFALCPHVWNGFLRLVTHASVFKRPSPIDVALAAISGWRDRPHSEVLPETAATWDAFTRLCRQQQAQGNAVYDLHLAALAIAHDRTLVSSDQGFSHIIGLSWNAP